MLGVLLLMDECRRFRAGDKTLYIRLDTTQGGISSV